MSNKGKNGTYGIIIGCVFAVAVIGLAVTSNIKSRMNDLKSETAQVTATAVPKKNEETEPETIETKPVQAVTAVKSKKYAEPAATDAAESTPELKEPEFVAPSDGKISVPFSKNPIYSKTFDDYRSHLAIDIDAAKSTPVKAISDGKIEKIYTDPLYGITIEIRHSGNLVSKYCCLSAADLVKEGDTVKAGDVISGIGTTGAAEKEQVPHLHLETILDGVNVDPMDYIS